MGNITLELRSKGGQLKATLLNDFALRIFSDLTKGNQIKAEYKHFKGDACNTKVYVLTDSVSINTRIMEVTLFDGDYVKLD